MTTMLQKGPPTNLVTLSLIRTLTSHTINTHSLPTQFATFISSQNKLTFTRFMSTASNSSNGAQKPKVFISTRIPREPLELIRDHCEVEQFDSEDVISREKLLQSVQGKAGLFCILENKIDKDFLSKVGPEMKVVSSMSVGFDHIDTKECEKRGIAVGNTPGVLTETTADLTLSLILATSRRLIEASAAVKSGEWVCWKPLWMCGADLHHSTVGIIGMGRIGQAVAKRLKGFGCKVLYSGSKPKADVQDAEFVSLDVLLSSSDFISLHAPLTPETKLMCNESFFKQMKPSAIFINTSRGGLVDQKALYHALTTGTIAAAGLDVTSPEPLPTHDPLLTLPNCVILPHIGSSTLSTRTQMAFLAAKNLIAGVTDQKLLHSVVDPKHS
eukprot:TRINITY_DN3497_c0_g1_i1.p2 TRINITY_DN3497_c0_g1~~TRINITY_DN3497_c0_g1_i1.p2  ORF type:complete len:385 (+),score=67.73 TRINITY_DN3497_c0_g1_i1:1180-2334(+)